MSQQSTDSETAGSGFMWKLIHITLNVLCISLKTVESGYIVKRSI